MRSKRLPATFFAGLALAATAFHPGAAGASAAGSTGGRWASPDTAAIHPGVKVTMGGVDCLAGFVLVDGKKVFLTITGGCASVWPGEDVNGCGNDRDAGGVDPPRTPATIQGAKHEGWLAYHSWSRMKLQSETRPNRCQYNNLALVRVDPRDVKRVNPSIPAVGGPERVAKAQPVAPTQLTAFIPTMANAQAIDTTANGWAHTAMVDGHVSATEAGAPVLTPSGAALGMVTVVPPQGTVGQTIVSDLRRELRALREVDRFADVHLAKATVPYKGPSFPSP
jgi:prepilin-type processing-associated H-X9-DG protein